MIRVFEESSWTIKCLLSLPFLCKKQMLEATLNKNNDGKYLEYNGFKRRVWKKFSLKACLSDWATENCTTFFIQTRLMSTLQLTSSSTSKSKHLKI